MPYPISRRRFLEQSSKVALSSSIAGFLLAACGGAADNATTVEFWYGLDDGAQRQYVKTHDVDAFNKAFPDSKVDLSFKPASDIDRLIQTALPAGKGPDIVPTPGPSYALQYINADLLLDLGKYAEQYDWKSKIAPWALGAGQMKGKLYSLPGSYQTLVMYYRPFLARRAGRYPHRERSLRGWLRKLRDRASCLSHLAMPTVGPVLNGTPPSFSTTMQVPMHFTRH